MSIANPYLHGEHAHLTEKQLRLKRLATFASLSVATTLILTKLIAYFATNSVALLSSLMDSCFDLMASVVALIGVRQAAEPADKAHRFGHGKVEALASLAQAVFISGSALFLVLEALQRMVTPQPVTGTGIGMMVMVLSIILTLILVIFQKHVIKKTASVAISADHLHYMGDLLMNAAVIAALFLTQYTGWLYFDPIFALAIATLLLKGAWEITGNSFDILMDKELPEDDRTKIMSLVEQHKEVRAIHDLRTRSSGQQVFIEFHLEIDGTMTLQHAHDITEDIERVLYEAFPTAEVLIHQEPAGIDDHRIDERVEEQEKQSKTIL